VHYWAGKFGGLGHLYAPGAGEKPKPWLPFALDNGAYSAFKNQSAWSADAFRKHVERYAQRAPLWILAPDVVGDATATRALWDAWYPELAQTGVDIAFAVQDGMTSRDLPIEARVIFVGGTTAWKRRTMYYWTQSRPRVHIGRINTEKWLWRAFEAGAESCDGTGFFRGRHEQLDGLRRFLERRAAGYTTAPARNYELFAPHEYALDAL
jgi:hypothetical protein